MGEESKISWCDATFNPWMGCSKVSPACANCYAERDWDHRFHKVTWGPTGTRVMTAGANWKKPLQWNREATLSTGEGPLFGEVQRFRVFCASLADVFEMWDGPMLTHDGGRLVINPAGEWLTIQVDKQSVPSGSRFATMNDVRRRLFTLIDMTPRLDWLLLTKRPENIREMWPDQKLRKNVWLGCSVENQEYADKRIPELMKSRDLSPVLFLSCEPVVGPINLTSISIGKHEYWDCLNGVHVRQDSPQSCPTVDWVIAGGESGPNARPSSAKWFRELRNQCEFAKVPFHFKQWGEFDQYGVRTGRAASGNMLGGVVHQEFPKTGVEL